MADHHLVVATPDPTSVLDLYRFIKLAAIRRVLSMFLMREVMAEGLANRDYSSVEKSWKRLGRPTNRDEHSPHRPWELFNRPSFLIACQGALV